MTTKADRLDFPIVPFARHPTARVFMVGFLAAAIIACFIFGVLFVTGQASGELTGFVLLLVPVTFMFMTWVSWRENRGSVELEPERLIVRTGAGRSIYGWDSVGSIRLLNFEQLGGLSDLSARLMRLDRTSPFVEVRLLKAPRVLLFGRGTSTDAFGIPQLIRTLHLHLVDPQGFITESRPFLRGGAGGPRRAR